MRVAMLSKWHVHARDYARQLQAMENVRIAAVWDEEPERGKEWAYDLGVDFEKDLDKILCRDDIDAVVIDSPTNMHADIMVSSANAGKHIFTEKAMALTVKDCNRISDAVKKAGVKFGISFPARTLSPNLYVKKAIDEGLLGDITLLRIRNGHNGALANWLPEYWYDEQKAGGGAMMDLGCHPMYLAGWFLGKPKRINSMFSYYTGREVEDNAQCSIEFENNSVAIVETSFVTYNTPGILEAYGTEGTILLSGNDIKITSKKMPEEFKGWIIPANIPKPLPLPINQWVNAVSSDTPILYGIEEGTKLTELLEAAYISHKEKRQVNFSDLHCN